MIQNKIKLCAICTYMCVIVFFFFNAYLNPFGNITFTILYIHIYNYIDTFQYNIRTIKWAYTHNYREGDTHEKKEIIKKKRNDGH